MVVQLVTYHNCIAAILYAPAHMYIHSQTISRLKVLLKRDNITFNERSFETEDGIAGLGENAFVSVACHLANCLLPQHSN